MTKKIKLKNVPYTVVSTYFGRENSGSQAETWKVALRAEPRSVNAYVKLTKNYRQTIAELACAQVGKALGLNVPDCYLVYVNTDNLPEEVKRESMFANRGEILAFASGSPDPDVMSFERLVIADNDKANELFDAWEHLDLVIAFDEWIANPDRTMCNYLFSPADSDFWLIDHGSALTGNYMPNWALHDTKVETHNALYESIAHQKELNEKYEMKKKATALMSKAHNVDLDTLDSSDFYKMIDSDVNVKEIAKFLHERIDYSVKLLCQKLGIPQLL
ncbi:hypothetical protein GTH32_17025 [Alteromonas sp. 345S023]|uniref:HipA-like kinase domain-containing protein n=1 Tax=Alteromonas profundi TaxID=2696062 RepID=A0A7X5LNY0_9ALTE|nr:HipA family kinase [Alteromonas profundi]NDV92872.1 hypothetical protein [Alteromonas profundi]